MIAILQGEHLGDRNVMDQRGLQEMEANRQRWLHVDAKVESNLSILAKKYKQCVSVNDYGVEVYDAWNREATNFIRTVLAQDIPGSWLDTNRDGIIKEITARAQFGVASLVT